MYKDPLRSSFYIPTLFLFSTWCPALEVSFLSHYFFDFSSLSTFPMARIILPLVSILYVFSSQALAAPLYRRAAVKVNIACDIPNTDISAAQTFLSEINPLNDVVAPGGLLTAELALANASDIASAIAGFPPANGTAPVTIDASSQASIVSGIQAAQAALATVQVLGNVNVNKTTQNIAQASAFLVKGLKATQALSASCFTGAGAAASGNGITDTIAAGAPGSAATTTLAAGAPGSAATTTTTVTVPGSAATTTFAGAAASPFAVPAEADDEDTY
ncbi:hypothetical protein B0H11DRAFT_335764 [Mycena galericulata]|nr:hypothetical protein B0H11DRAFT_335764 [Mycena galericulata]